MEDSNQVHSIFQTKYDEFADDLLGTFPEYTDKIRAAIALSEEERLKKFQEEVVIPEGDDFSRNPGTIFPGMKLEDSVWKALSENTHKAIWEYLRLLSMCCFLESGFGANSSKPGWMDDAMKDWKEKLSSVDFDGLMGKFMNFFKAGTDGSDSSSSPGPASGFEGAFPKLPEKFMKGHLARLAEEMVRDIKPEDLGLTPAMIEECEKSPSRSFDLLIQLFTKNPDMIQGIVKKIGNRLQQKMQNGSIRPAEIAREAEELMKEFSANPEFVDMMGTMKSMFGFENMDLAKKVNKEGDARRSIMRERLRRKLEQQKAGGTTENATRGGKGKRK
jgi:hypothetical protein